MENKIISVLIVEDEPSHAEAICRALEASDQKFKTCVVSSLHKYWVEIAERIPDIVLTDLNLPDGKAFEIFSNPPENLPYPIIVMTAYGNEEIVTQALKTGASDYIVKTAQRFAEIPHIISRSLREWSGIIDRQRAKEALRESEERFSLAINGTGAGLWDWDMVKDQVVYSEQWKKMLGYEIHEIEDTFSEWKNLWHPDDCGKIEKAIDDYITGKSSYYEIIHRCRHKNGDWRWILTRGDIIKDAQKKPIRWVGTNIDITERKRAEETLKESKDQISQLLQTTDQGIYGIDLYGNCTFINKSGLNALQYQIEECVGKNMHDLIHHSHSDGSPYPVEECPIFRAKLTGIGCRVESDVLWRKDGTSFPAEYSSHPIFENGKIKGAVVTFIDITERMQAGEALRESENRYKKSQEIGHIGSWEYNIKNDTFWGSNEGKKIYGFNLTTDIFSAEEVMKCVIDKDLVNQAMVDLIEKNVPYNIVFTINPLNSSEKRTINSIAELVRDENGNPLKVTGVLHDITDRKQAEGALRDSEAKHKKMIENISDVIAIMYKDGIMGYKSPNIEKWFGWLPEDLVDTDGWATVHPDDLERIQNKFFTLLEKDNASKTVEYRYKCKDGSYKWIELTATNLTNDPIINGVLMNYHDITGRKQSEAEHLRLQNLESLGVLAGGIAHDFNNILAVILGRASMALSYTEEGSIKNDLLAIEKASRRAIGLTQQLLTFAKGGAPEKCVIDIRKIIKDTTKFALSGSNVISKFNFKDSSTIDADPGQISQVIQNLVINAKQAMPSGGTLDITTEQYFDDNQKQYVRIIIKDCGGGISKENIDKIFDPYFTTKETGTGLGLSVCYSIIQRHDGQISIESEIGKGTTFTILLPSQKVEIKEKVESKNVVTKGLNVLIMDDQETIRELLTDLLFHLGHKVTATKEGGEAIKKYNEAKDRKEQFDILFFDLTVPGGMGGKEAVKKLREIDPNVKVIVSSGYADSSISSYKADGFDGVLKKPYSKAELNQVIFDVMNK